MEEHLNALDLVLVEECNQRIGLFGSYGDLLLPVAPEIPWP